MIMAMITYFLDKYLLSPKTFEYFYHIICHQIISKFTFEEFDIM